MRSGNFGGTGATPSEPTSPNPSSGAEAPIAASRKARGEKTWITDGSVGMEAQGIAVAEAVGLPFSLKRVRPKGAMRFLPAPLQILVPPQHLLRSVESNKPLAPPLAAPRHFHRAAKRAHRARGQTPRRRLRPAHPEP